MFQKHLVRSLLLTFLFLTVVPILYSLGFFEKADLFFYDLHFKLRGPENPGGKVTLVLMDQRSALELNRAKGEWSRLHMAKALENLCQSGAEIIGIDLVFFAPGHEEMEDVFLARAIEECNNVVLAKFISIEGAGEVVPLPIFQEGMIGDGFINMFPDRDGVLRRAPFLAIKPSEEGLVVSPGFSLELARTYLNLDFNFNFSGKDFFYLGADGPGRLLLPYPDLRINFSGDEKTFRCLSFVDVVCNRFKPEDINGKIVLLGSSLATDHDFFTTPLSGYNRRESLYTEKFSKIVKEDIGPRTVGVACHAQALETILNRTFIHKASKIYVFALTALLGFIGFLFYFQRPGALFDAFLLFSCLGIILWASYFFFVHRLTWIEIASPCIILLLQYIGGIALQRVHSRMKTKVVTSLFGKYVSPAVVNDILKGDGIMLEGRSQEVTVLFSDLRSFTSISEKLSPQETGHLLNTYFDAMIPIVLDHEGTLDKLMGDAIMAFFGAPVKLADHPGKAAETALKMLENLDGLKSGTKVRGIADLEVGIGLNTGRVVVGNLGSQRFMDYTVIGDEVNLGSRLEGLNKKYGTSIIISQATAAKLDSRFVLRELDRVRVKGKDSAVTIFELLGMKDNLKQNQLKMVDKFISGIEFYRQRNWDAADEKFYHALKLNPGDGPSGLYLARIKAFRKNPPSPEWDYVTVFETK